MFMERKTLLGKKIALHLLTMKSGFLCTLHKYYPQIYLLHYLPANSLLQVPSGSHIKTIKLGSRGKQPLQQVHTSDLS